MDNKLKHLDFIQNIITRMNSNSFMLKGWAITIITALLAVNFSNSHLTLLQFGYIPTIMFWLLDGYYLYQENMFCYLYDKVRALNEEEIDFSMHTGSNIIEFFSSLFSKTVFPLYGILLIIILIIS